MQARTFQIEHLACPLCDKGEHRCDHIEPGQTFGPWRCRVCNGSFFGRRLPTGKILVEASRERWVPTLDLLVLQPQEKPVYFVVEGQRLVHDDVDTSDQQQDSEANSKAYHYHEQSCPTNWLKPVVMAYDGDTDPHGLIRFVSYRDAPGSSEVDDAMEWLESWLDLHRPID